MTRVIKLRLKLSDFIDTDISVFDKENNCQLVDVTKDLSIEKIEQICSKKGQIIQKCPSSFSEIAFTCQDPPKYCNPGFHLNEKSNICEINICQCKNGISTKHLQCQNHNFPSCSSCNLGYKLKDVTHNGFITKNCTENLIFSVFAEI